MKNKKLIQAEKIVAHNPAIAMKKQIQPTVAISKYRESVDPKSDKVNKGPPKWGNMFNCS